MTNPHPTDSDLTADYSWNSPRFTYTSIASPPLPGTTFLNHPARTHAFSQLLQHDLDMTSDSTAGAPASAAHASYNALRNHAMDSHRYTSTSTSNGVSSRPAAGATRRQSQLGLLSRAFEMFTSPTYLQQDGFFIPSYLKDTAYANRLQDAHQAKLRALRDARTQEPQAGGAALATSTTTNGSIHSKPPPQAESASFDVIERPETQDDPSSVPPLPTRWSKTDKYQGIDIMGEGVEVRYTSHKQGHEYETAAVRANNPIPPECGIYYYEVTITYGKRDE